MFRTACHTESYWYIGLTYHSYKVADHLSIIYKTLMAEVHLLQQLSTGFL
ncbi:hypothetical protein TNCV_1788281, partial [Trichonephila clavipes]